MAFTHSINQRVISGGTQISKTIEKSAGGKASLSETIPDSSTDLAVAFALDVSACRSFYMVADQVLLIEPNDGTTPDDPITLVAGQPYIFFTGGYDTFNFGTDIASLFVTNASGEDALLEIEAIYDPTP
jgi:hypothetical protein